MPRLDSTHNAMNLPPDENSAFERVEFKTIPHADKDGKNDPLRRGKNLVLRIKYGRDGDEKMAKLAPAILEALEKAGIPRDEVILKERPMGIGAGMPFDLMDSTALAMIALPLFDYDKDQPAKAKKFLEVLEGFGLSKDHAAVIRSEIVWNPKLVMPEAAVQASQQIG